MQFAGAYGETGVRYTLAVAAGDAQALSRQVRSWQGGHKKHILQALGCPVLILRVFLLGQARQKKQSHMSPGGSWGCFSKMPRLTEQHEDKKRLAW